LFDAITYTWDEAAQTLQGDLTQVAAQLTTALTANRTTGLAQLADFARALKGMGALSSLDTTGFQTALAPLGGDVTGTLNSAWVGLVATNGNDSLSGSNREKARQPSLIGKIDLPHGLHLRYRPAPRRAPSRRDMRTTGKPGLKREGSPRRLLNCSRIVRRRA
jgi:hypothetical protein